MDYGMEQLQLDGPALGVSYPESGLRVGRGWIAGARIGDPNNVTPAHQERWARERKIKMDIQDNCRHVWYDRVTKFGPDRVCGGCGLVQPGLQQPEVDELPDPFDGGGSVYVAPPKPDHRHYWVPDWTDGTGDLRCSDCGVLALS